MMQRKRHEGKAGENTTGRKENAKSLGSRRRIVVGVRYLGVRVKEVMRNGVGGAVKAR
jgi:hypothetical protein